MRRWKRKRTGSIDLKEFVPVGKIDPIYFESVYYLGPDEGGEKPYRLLAEALARSERAAVAELVSRGKEPIVIIRPYRGGLVLHEMFYKNEVKDVGQIPRAESERGTQDEVNLATGLIGCPTINLSPRSTTTNIG